MTTNGRSVLLCHCEGTAPIPVPGASQCLCRTERGRLVQALAEGPVLVGCTQEAALFDETAAEAGHPPESVRTVDIRTLAGWSDEAAESGPKIAALLAEAALERPPVPLLTLESSGVVLVYGRDDAAIEAARLLAEAGRGDLDLTVLLTRTTTVAPRHGSAIPVVRGRIRNAAGHLGAFSLVVDGFASPAPSSRAALVFGPARDGAVSRCDIILDLSGGPALFPAGHRRDGYLRADPDRPAAVLEAVLKASALAGSFDRPRHIAFREALCAHSRNRRIGCNRCLDVCPTGAISPAGDHVALDPYVCAGCGNCAAVCPTGAVAYAAPPPAFQLERLRALLGAYAAAGGRRAVLLIHDGEHGLPLIDMLARHGPGLPARVLPFAVEETTQLGPDAFLAAIAFGAAEVRLLLQSRRRDDLEALGRTLGFVETVLSGLGFGAGRCGTVETDDPEELGRALRALPRRDGVAVAPFQPLGDARALTRLALRALHAAAPVAPDVLPLPTGAAFGTLAVDTDGCSLCLACVGVCPTGALGDDPERPTLTLAPEACVQCGLCRATCPEDVIRLVPQIDFRPQARERIVLKQEEPAHCLRCAKPFGTRASIARIEARLEGRHWMFPAGGATLRRIRLCADCRAIESVEAELDPHRGPDRPRPKTTEDWLRDGG